MAAPVYNRVFTQDITQKVETRHGGGLVFNGNNGSMTLGVRLYDGGEPLAPSGAVTGQVILADGQTALTEAGTIEGNLVSVTLNQSCFAVEGPIVASISVTDDGVKTTVLRAAFTVALTSSGPVIDPGQIVPDVEDIVAQYSEMQRVTAEAQAAASTALSAASLPGYLGQAAMTVPVDDRVTLAAMAGGTVNPTDGHNQSSTFGCKIGYSPITGPVLFRFEPTTEMESLMPQGVKWNIWKYSGSTISTAKYSLTGGNWSTVPVAIPYEGWSTENIRIGFSSIDESIALAPSSDPDVAARLAAITASIKFYTLTDTTLTTSGAAADAKATGDALATLDAGSAAKPRITLSMFQTVGVIGDSFASGHLDSTSGDNYAQSWVQVMARHYGFDAANYSRGGIKAAEWLTHANGLSKMQSDIPRQLYFIALGINDASSGTDLTAFKSTLTEIAGDVRAHSPNAVLCFVTLARLGTSANPAAYLPYSDAIAEVATAVGGLLIRSETLPVVDSSFWPRYSGHPTAPEYAALAEAYGRAFEAAALEAQTTLDGFNSLEPIMNVRALETETDVPLIWEQGTITTSGATGDSTLRCRTVGATAPQAYSDLGFILTIPEGFKAYIYTYIGTPNYSGFAGTYISAWQSGEVSINIPAGRFIKLNGAKLDDSAVTPSDMAGFTLKRRGYTDTTLSKADKAADAQKVGALGALLIQKGLITQAEWEAITT